MSFSDIWKLRKRGQRDSDRHKELLKKAIKTHGKDLITEFNVIKSDGNKKIKVPIKFLERYQFKYGPHTEQKGAGHGGSNIKPGQAYKIKGPESKGSAGNERGEKTYDVEVSIDELVELMLEDLDLPWMLPTSNSKVEVEEEEFTSIERKGVKSNLDIKKTLVENLKRNSLLGKTGIQDFSEDDLRYRVWENEKEYHSNAAVYLMLDRSASMDLEKTKIAKTFYFWIVQYLKKRYKNIEIVFIAHDTEAFTCEEEQFFKVSSTGGTKCSSSFELAYNLIRNNHPPEDWSCYVIELSDGDNYGDDNLLVLEYVQKLLPLVRALGYGEIVTDSERHNIWYSNDRLLSKLLYESVKRTKFVSFKMKSTDDVFNAIKYFFNVEGIADKTKRSVY